MRDAYGTYLTDEHTEVYKTNGLSYNTVWERIYNLGWTVEKAISTPVQKMRGFKSLYDNHNNPLNISYGAALWRVNKGESLESALSYPPTHRKGLENSEKRNKYEPICKKNNIKWSTFCTRVDRLFWTCEEASTIPIRIDGRTKKDGTRNWGWVGK